MNNNMQIYGKVNDMDIFAYLPVNVYDQYLYPWPYMLRTLIKSNFVWKFFLLILFEIFEWI